MFSYRLCRNSSCILSFQVCWCILNCNFTFHHRVGCPSHWMAWNESSSDPWVDSEVCTAIVKLLSALAGCMWANWEWDHRHSHVWFIYCFPKTCVCVGGGDTRDRLVSSRMYLATHTLKFWSSCEAWFHVIMYKLCKKWRVTGTTTCILPAYSLLYNSYCIS